MVEFGGCPRAFAPTLNSPSQSSELLEGALKSFPTISCRLEESGWSGTGAEELQERGLNPQFANP